MTKVTLLSQALLHSRRRFLLRTAGTMAFPLALVACGGGSDFDNTPTSGSGSGTGGGGTGTGTGSGSTTPVVTLTTSQATGTIVMPAGASATVASVKNVFGSSVPASDGTFTFTSAAESEMFAVAFGPGGKMLLSGLLQAGSAQLSARSTAVCLAYTVLAVGVYLPSTQEQYLVAIQASLALTALETAVAAAIVARGEGWLDLTDAALKGALSAMQAALSPTALVASTTTATRGRIETSTEAAGDARMHTQGMVIDKTARTSGIQITGDGFGSITLSNYYRRRSYAYVERVSHRDTFTGADVDDPMIIGVTPMKIDATKSITNTLVTLAQLYAGVKDFYDPVVTDPIPTPLTPTTAALTTYRVTSVGLGVSLGDLALLTDDQKAGLRNVCAETVVLDILVPIFTGILIPIRAASMASFTHTIGVSALKDVVSALAASDDILLNKIVAGNRPLGEILWDASLTVINSDNFKNAFLAFYEQILNAISLDPNELDGSVANIGAKAILDAISTIDLTAQAMDLVVTGLSYAFSDLADRFTIDVTKSQVRLNPQNPQIAAAGLPTNFTLSVIDSDLTSGDLSYQWSCTCLFGEVGSGSTSSTNGASFPSSSEVLAYNPLGHAKGGDQDVVTGTVYKGSVLSTRVPIGTATSTISYATVISPSPVQLLVGTQQTFTADISAAVLADGTAKYVWTLSGGGSIGGSATVTTTTPSISYTAGSAAGSDSLSLSVVSSTGQVLSTGSATIGVLGSVAAGIAPQNPQVPRGTTLNFVVNPAGSSFPSGTTFKWVLTRPLDLFGGMRDLGGSGGGIIGVGISAPTVSGPLLGFSITVTTTTPTITFGANPFGPEAVGTTFIWYQDVILTVSVIGAGGAVLATSSTPIQTQIPTGILLP